MFLEVLWFKARVSMPNITGMITRSVLLLDEMQSRQLPVKHPPTFEV